MPIIGSIQMIDWEIMSMSKTFEGKPETHKLDVIYELLTSDYKELAARNEKTALAFGMMIGQVSNLLNEMAIKDRNQVCELYKDAYRELKDIWKAAGLQIHGIYYKPELKEFLETILNQKG